MPKLSVITCVYNTKPEYLEYCLSSVNNSSLKDIEIIVVDDGSSVNYLKVLKRFENVKYVKTENHGPLLARFAGVNLATSPLVAFIDSDDFVSFNYYEALVKKQEETNADIVFNDYAVYYDKLCYFLKNDITIKNHLSFKEEDGFKNFLSQQGEITSFYVLWNKVYKVSCLKKAISMINIEKVKMINYAEDVLLNFFTFYCANLIVNTHCGFYYYRRHDSQLTNYCVKGKILDQSKKILQVFDIFVEFLNKNNLKEYFFYIKKWKQLIFSYQFNLLSDLNDKKTQKELIALSDRSTKYHKIKKMLLLQTVLPKNFKEIEKTLEDIYYDKSANITVYCKKNSFSYKQLNYIKQNLNKKDFIFVKNKKKAKYVIKEKYDFIDKFLRIPPIFLVGQFLFPNGSRRKNFFKKLFYKNKT